MTHPKVMTMLNHSVTPADAQAMSRNSSRIWEEALSPESWVVPPTTEREVAMSAAPRKAPIFETRDEAVASSVVLVTLVVSVLCGAFVVDVASTSDGAERHHTTIASAE